MYRRCWVTKSRLVQFHNLEVMKMFAAVASTIAGTVSEIAVKVGESVESKDLLVRLVK
jgi:pyruvate carboxylase